MLEYKITCVSHNLKFKFQRTSLFFTTKENESLIANGRKKIIIVNVLTCFVKVDDSSGELQQRQPKHVAPWGRLECYSFSKLYLSLLSWDALFFLLDEPQDTQGCYLYHSIKKLNCVLLTHKTNVFFFSEGSTVYI